jgi:hypothetical protein
MNTIFLGVAALLAFLLMAKSFANANPALLARGFKQVIGLTLLIFSGFLLMTGRYLVAIPLVVFGLGMLLPKLLRARTGSAAADDDAAEAGRRSSVRTAILHMELDHDSGDLRGRVLAGPFAGRDLARLTADDLRQLWRDLRSDPESRALLEAYLDRRDPFWREDLNGDTASGHGGAAAAGAMTEQEAYKILGLEPGVGETEIRDAHRRLMKAVHPDHGGSTFLAAKINEAKDRLIGKHRTRSNH